MYIYLVIKKINRVVSKKIKIAISCYITQGAKLGALWWPRRVGWGEKREGQKEGDIYIAMSGSHCCMAETTWCCKAIFLQLKNKFRKD